MANDVKVNGGISFAGLLAIVFIVLKLTKVISWSWWWVLSPLWIPVALTFVFIIVWVATLFFDKR
jgi:hypothetical protein